MSLSTNGQRLLIARVIGPPSAAAPEAIGESDSAMPASPFVERSLTTFRRSDPAASDLDASMTAQVTTSSVEFAVLELDTLEARVLLRAPAETALRNLAWSLDDAKLALVLGQVPDNTRGGVVPIDSDTVQDGLGRLPPKKNPFFTNSVVHLFTLDGPKIDRVDLRPTLADGQIFARVVWGPDARRLLVEIRTGACGFHQGQERKLHQQAG